MQSELLELIRQKPGITSKEIKAIAGINRTSVDRQIRSLKDQGKIKQVRKARFKHIYLNERKGHK